MNDKINGKLNFELSTLPQYIDHTLLKPTAIKEEIHRLCEEALQYQFYSVCVNSSWVAECRKLLNGSGIGISAVCGFPLGANGSNVKAYEAAYCVEQGASEIDMVLSVGHLIDGNTSTIIHDIEQVVKAVSDKAIVKVILETGFLNDEQIREACRCSEQAGAHFVKTSTGFGPRGASVADIHIMKGSVSKDMGIKASGGIRNLETAVQMIEAGATRLGASSGVAIMQGIAGNEGY